MDQKGNESRAKTHPSSTPSNIKAIFPNMLTLSKGKWGWCCWVSGGGGRKAGQGHALLTKISLQMSTYCDRCWHSASPRLWATRTRLSLTADCTEMNLIFHWKNSSSTLPTETSTLEEELAQNHFICNKHLFILFIPTKKFKFNS